MASLYNSLNELQLIDLLKKDDESALSEIYERYAIDLANFAGAKLHRTEDATDLIHDLFVKLWEDRKQLKVDRNLRAYLFTLTRRRIIDQIRKNIVRQEYAEMIEVLTVQYESTLEQKLAAKELQHTINQSLAQLSPRLKQIYWLSRNEELSIPEIAQRLQISEQTVKNQLSAALKHLRQSIALLIAFFF